MKFTVRNATQVAQDFSASLRALSSLTGFSEKTVTLAEVGTILKACVGKTKVAPPEATDNYGRREALRHLKLTTSAGPESVTVNSGLRGPAGFVWWRLPADLKRRGATGRPYMLAGVIASEGQKFTPAKRHFKNSDWYKIYSTAETARSAIATAIPRARLAAQLPRQSWVQIADDLGLTLEDIPGGSTSAAAIAKARTAISTAGRTYQNGTAGERYELNKSYVASLINAYPQWPKMHLDTVILGVVAGRATYFKQNVSRAVLASHAATARAYPWIKLLGGEEAPLAA